MVHLHEKIGAAAPAITLDGNHTYVADSSSHIVIASKTLRLTSPGDIITVPPSVSFSVSYPGHTIALLSPSAPGATPVVAIDATITQTLLNAVATATSNPSPKEASTPPSSTSSTTSSPEYSSGASSSASAASASMSGSSTASAASQSSSSSKPSTQKSSSSKDLSKGAAAGIGVGCAAAGALIAAFIVFLLMRRKRRSRPSRSYPLQEKAATNGGANSKSPASGAFALAESSLPLPLEDAAIGGEISRLQTLIKNYAQSYYHTSPVTTKTPDLSALGPNLSIPAATLAAMLANPRTRIVAIRYCLAWIVFSRLGLDSDANTSLLPPEVASCARPMSADTASKSEPPLSDSNEPAKPSGKSFY